MIRIYENKIILELQSSSPLENAIQIQQSLIILIQHLKIDEGNELSGNIFWVCELIKAMQITPKQIGTLSKKIPAAFNES